MAEDSFNSAQKKSKLSSDESVTNFILQVKQETEDDKLGSVIANHQDCAKYGIQEFGEFKQISNEENEVGIHGIQEVESCNKGLSNSCVIFHEKVSESIIDENENQLLVEHERESFSVVATQAVEFTDLDSSGEILGDIGCGKETGIVGFAGLSDINGYKINVKQETRGKKEKQARKRGTGSKRGSRTNGDGKGFSHTIEKQSVYEKIGDGSQLLYPRRVLEALRYVGLEEQKKKWTEVYCGLGPDMAMEYDGLVYSGHRDQNYVNFDPRQQFMKNKAAHDILGGETENLDSKIENMNHLDPACGLNGSDVDGYPGVAEDCSEDDDSDAEYASIQKPAFVVTGEPNFDSGPPQDGLEYLRRVRWEAEQIPKVKVAMVEASKFNKEQTVYMPNIPDIAECPEHLMPSKQWEDVFLADFSELRLALSHEESFGLKSSGKLQSVPLVHDEFSNHILESMILENTDNLTSDKVDSCQSPDYTSQHRTNVDENGGPRSASGSKFSVSEVSIDWPSLPIILGMEPVARVSTLRKRVKSVETMSTLSRNDCAWLFALCATVDTPLDADTCASLRCLLRKCASLRAGKSELDDEVIVLNILVTISGKYFRQSEN